MHIFWRWVASSQGMIDLFCEIDHESYLKKQQKKEKQDLFFGYMECWKVGGGLGGLLCKQEKYCGAKKWMKKRGGVGVTDACMVIERKNGMWKQEKCWCDGWACIGLMYCWWWWWWWWCFGHDDLILWCLQAKKMLELL